MGSKNFWLDSLLPCCFQLNEDLSLWLIDIVSDMLQQEGFDYE